MSSSINDVIAQGQDIPVVWELMVHFCFIAQIEMKSVE